MNSQKESTQRSRLTVGTGTIFQGNDVSGPTGNNDHCKQLKQIVKSRLQAQCCKPRRRLQILLANMFVTSTLNTGAPHKQEMVPKIVTTKYNIQIQQEQPNKIQKVRPYNGPSSSKNIVWTWIIMCFRNCCLQGTNQGFIKFKIYSKSTHCPPLSPPQISVQMINFEIQIQKLFSHHPILKYNMSEFQDQLFNRL